ncbi:hypothetical protein Tco_1293006 [Tanacetum coccineum]
MTDSTTTAKQPKHPYAADNRFKPGYPQSIQDLMDVSIPNLRLQANPHIKSRLETLKGNFGVYARLTHPKATGLRDKPFIYYHKLSTIFGKDRAMGSRAVDLGEEEVVYEMEKTTPTNFEDIDIDMGVNLSPKIVGGKVQKEIDALLGITFEEAFKVTDVIGVENHPPMLERSQYDSWQSRMLLYIRGKEHGIQLLEDLVKMAISVWNVEVHNSKHTCFNTESTSYKTLARKTDLIPKEKIHEVCDIRATNIILQGLPPDVYTLVNHHIIAKEIWDRVKLLIKGLKLLLQERESKMYNEFDRFTFEKGETIHSYYLRFAKLINEMNTIGMTTQKL